MFSLSYLFNLLFLRFLSIPVLGEYVMLQTLSLIFLGFFILLLFSSMVTSLSTEFMSSDLDHLFSTDLTGRVLFWAKSGEALFHAGWMVIVFAYPVLVSYGHAIGAPWFYYPMAFVVLYPFVLIPFAIGNFIINLVMYFIPVKRVRSVMIGLGVTFGALLIYLFRLLSPRILFEPELARDRYRQLLEVLDVGQLTGLPSHHAAYLLHRITSEDVGGVYYHGSWLLGMALAIPLLVGFASQHWYRESWLRTREGRPNHGSGLSVSGWRIWSIVPSQYAALFKKELLQFLRQATQWSQLLVLGGIVVVYVSNLLKVPATSEFLNYVIFFVNMVLIGFVMTAICVRFVFPSISFEGEYFWIVRSAPLTMYQFFAQKALFYVIPVGLLGGLTAIITNGSLAVSWTLRSWSVLFLTGLSITLTASALTIGAYFPKFNFDHFGEVVTSAGSVIYMVFGMFYVVGIVALSVLPVYYTMNVYPEGGLLLESVFPATVLVLTIVNLLVGFVLLGLGARKVDDFSSGRL
jgi:ABC-2 type transport system permease protein